MTGRPLRVELTVGGGFAPVPGLARPLVVDAAGLAADDHSELRRICASALAIADDRDARARLPVPDGRSYRLRIEQDGASREIVAADPIHHPAIADLIAFIQAHGRRSH